MPNPRIVTDMDGTLTAAETWRAVLAWVREHHPSPAARRFVAVRLPLVALRTAGLLPKEGFRARWLADEAGLLRDLSASRLAELGEWVVERHLWPARRAGVVELVAAAVREARAADPATGLVLASGTYRPVAEAFARRIGADEALATPLELRDGRATGALAAPTQSGEQKAAAVRALAGGAPILAAFGDTEADVPLLAMARRAVAVAPDPQLRRIARERDWEIVEG